MPTYDYTCSACGHALEEFQSMSAKPLKKCPQCGKSALERGVGGGAGLIFKGSGFWQNDRAGAKGGKKTDDAPEAPKPPAGCGGGCACHPKK